MPRIPGNKLELGLADARDVLLEMTPQMRSTHLRICGPMCTGKSKMLAHLIRQDIAKWPQTNCGPLVADPHSSLYDGLIKWMAWNEASIM